MFGLVENQVLKIKLYPFTEKFMKLPQGSPVHNVLPDGFGLQTFSFPQRNVIGKTDFVQFIQVAEVPVFCLGCGKRRAVF